jgi:hypothetical protein
MTPLDGSLHRVEARGLNQHEYSGRVKTARKEPLTKKNPKTSQDLEDPKPMHFAISKRSVHKQNYKRSWIISSTDSPVNYSGVASVNSRR